MSDQRDCEARTINALISRTPAKAMPIQHSKRHGHGGASIEIEVARA